MSSAVVSTSAALSRPFVFETEPEPEIGPLSTSYQDSELEAYMGTAALGCPVERNSTEFRRNLLPSTINNPHSKLPPASITPASRLAIRPAPEMASSGIPALDALTGGLPRGCLTELCGQASSGRTTVLLAALSAATRRGEFCALIDASDALDPHSAASAGIDLDHLLWVRCNENSPQRKNSPQRHRETEKTKKEEKDCGCPILAAPFAARVGTSSEHRLEQVLRATDLLLESGGFGLIALDLADLPPQAARRIPLTTWFRFRRVVEHKPTILLAIEQQPIAGSCSSLLLQLGAQNNPEETSNQPSHARLLTGLNINVELTRSRLERKPARSIAFETKTAWAG